MSSSAFSLTAMFAETAFRVVEGAPVKGGMRGPELDHYFCPDCKTWVYTRIAALQSFVNLRPTMFDDLRWTEPFIETMTAEKLPWVRTAPRHSFEGFPSMEEFQTLLAEFAASG